MIFISIALFASCFTIPCENLVDEECIVFPWCRWNSDSNKCFEDTCFKVGDENIDCEDECHHGRLTAVYIGIECPGDNIHFCTGRDKDVLDDCFTRYLYNGSCSLPCVLSTIQNESVCVSGDMCSVFDEFCFIVPVCQLVNNTCVHDPCSDEIYEGIVEKCETPNCTPHILHQIGDDDEYDYTMCSSLGNTFNSCFGFGEQVIKADDCIDEVNQSQMSRCGNQSGCEIVQGEFELFNHNLTVLMCSINGSSVGNSCSTHFTSETCTHAPTACVWDLESNTCVARKNNSPSKKKGLSQTSTIAIIASAIGSVLVVVVVVIVVVFCVLKRRETAGYDKILPKNDQH